MKRIGVMALLLAFLMPAFAIDVAEFEKDLTVHKLDNGLTFLIYERHDAPVVSFHTYVNVGSANEQTGITGISHMLEHMAFKGTTTVGTKDLEKELAVMKKIDAAFLKLYAMEDGGAAKEDIETLKAEIQKLQEEAESYAQIGEFDQVISRNGSPDLNAFTGADATQYHFSLPSNKVELWCFLESERYFHPVFRQFYKERDVVAEERRMRTESNPIGKMIEQFQLMAFTYHPYHIPTIGAMSDIQRYTRAKVSAHFKKYYNPQNMTISIVGDVDPETLIPMLETYFGRMPAGEKAPEIVTVEPKQTVSREMIMEENSQPLYVVGYHRPAESHPDHAVFEAIGGIIGSGRSSRLYKRLVKEDKAAAYVGALNGYPGTKFPNLFLLLGIPTPDHDLTDLSTIIDEEVERLKTELVSEEELKKVKTQAKASLIYQLDSNMGIAQLLANYQVKRGDWRALFDDVKAIEAVTAEDVKRVANDYLRSDNRNIARLLPKSGQEQ